MRVGGDAQDAHAARFDLQDEQDVQPPQRHGLDAEEVDGDDPEAWVCRNCRQVGSWRRVGAGGIPARVRIRRMVDAFVRVMGGDVNAIAAASEPLDPDIVWYGTVGGLDEQSVAHGPDEVAAGIAESIAHWEKLTLEAERYIDAGDGRVIVFFHEIARSRHSSEVMETRTAVVYTLRDGKLVEARGYMNRDDALAAAGIPV